MKADSLRKIFIKNRARGINRADRSVLIMMRSLFSGVSGLKAHQTGMDTIGNNIANVNTVGFKASRTTFADTLSQTLTGASSPGDTVGGTNPKQIGLGTGVASIDMIFTDGSIQSTGKNTDLCLSGNGLFVVKNGDQTYYTRDGAFEFDAAGNYVLPGSGLYVQGWTATDGSVNTSSAAGNINIPAGKSMPSKASTQTTYSNNLDASTTMIKSISYTDAAGNPHNNVAAVEVDGQNVLSATLTLSDGTTQTVTSGNYTADHSIPVTTIVKVYDSLGTAHNIPLLIEKTGNNTWEVNLNDSKKTTTSITEDDGTTTTVTLTRGTIKFTETGSPSVDMANGSLAFTFGNGAATQSVTLDYNSLTQYAGKSTVNPSTDGNAAGTLSSVSVDSSGVITGTYTNGMKQTEAQVAIAQFTNASGLTKTGNSLYQESNNSGTANVKTAADLGCTITPSALEMSTTDISNEFSNMIITQRGFQSNSKIITVSDEMLETLINMKR